MNLLNVLSKVLLGVGIVDCWKLASKTKAAAQKAEQLARDKHLREAAQIVEKSLAAWSSQPRFWERLIRSWLVGNLLEQLKQQLDKWRRQIAEADELAASAKALLKKDTGNPLKSKAFSEALALYDRCSQIISDDSVLLAISSCKRELKQRQQFRQLVKEAELQTQWQFFKVALAAYYQAEQLYSTQSVKAAIAVCIAQLQHEETYEAALQQAQQAFGEGKLRSAIALLESALSKFSRRDGIELLEQLQRTVKGREKFRQGLNAEKMGALQGAAFMYEEAKAFLSDPTDCQIRLGIVAIKTEDWTTALSHLENVSGEQAAYLRGFALANQGNLQPAHREWHNLTQTTIGYQRDALKSLAQRQRLLAIQNIEQLVKNENLEKAKTASVAFIQKFGADSLVQANLDDHIQARIENAVWQGSDWGIIADTVEQVWIQQPNLTSLHNWVVANYYYALGKSVETQDFESLQDLTIALSTALANLRNDPALKDLPWLGNTPVDYDSVALDLQRRLEAAIDAFKDRNINQYLRLRDRYRLEMVTLRLMGNPPTTGLRVKEVYITPGCYELHKEKLKTIKFPAKLWGTLYTPWGLAVAACEEGDIQRAIQLKPSNKPTGEAELFGQKFVAYYEGCYLLQQQKWREAMINLNQAWAEIRASIDLQKELDRLCRIQRGAISDFEEHLEFAQSWCDLLASQAAKSYLAEYKAEQIRDKLVKEQISLKQALQELQKVKEIDEKNPVVIDMSENIEVAQEMQEILELLKRDRLSEAVSRAKYSKHKRVRFQVAEICIDLLIKGAETQQMPSELIYQLGKSAYEICPNEPAFQEVYRQLRLRY